MYDFLIIGAGVFGSVCAYELNKKGYKCLVIENREVVGGNCYTEEINGIHVHKHGAHIYHTNDKFLWDYIQQFAPFKNFINSPIANYKGKVYSLPFNMWTFNQLWGVQTPEEAQSKIESQRYKGNISNLEEQALSMVGKDVYEILIKGYTEKQWKKKATDLPPSIIKRLPVRFTWDNNYFNDTYQGMPVGGYTQIFENMLQGIEVRLGEDYFKDRDYYDSLAHKVIYTGPIDRFFNYKFGRLEYRSLKWENKLLEIDNFQGNPVVNYTDYDVPYTRIIEHKWFDNHNQKGTYISYEFSDNYNDNNEPYYPIRNDVNVEKYEKYYSLTKEMSKYYFGGRLATYVYYDIHQVIAQALKKIKEIVNV